MMIGRIEKKVLQRVGLIGLAAVLTGCRFPVELFFAPDSPPPSQINTAPLPSLQGGSQPVENEATLTPTSLPCAYAWAEQSLPDLTAEVQRALDVAGLNRVEALAVAYGENCVDTLNNQVVSFSVMETDFYFTVVVEDTGNREALGNLIYQLLLITEQFPPGKAPGPNPGLLTVLFQDEKQNVQVRAKLVDALAAKTRGLRGSALLEALQAGHP
ncbi:hypothetical protein ATHL_00675 [Anaerolinea thermolimosa]|nr:hypothetical protein [Anaerolinea thermolimosa]GAP05834.1 hypothetical protein ATHL_00675 [Anaerolinea thermolimosa]